MNLNDYAEAEEALRNTFLERQIPIEVCIGAAMRFLEAVLGEVKEDAGIPGTADLVGITFTLTPEHEHDGLVPMAIHPVDLVDNSLAAVIAERLTSVHMLQEAE